MIPKVIHYCWFGGNSLPESAIRCIESWKKYAPNYQIIEWNESNFDFHKCSYIEEAYQAKKWAFVSDYTRFYILYHEGGVYFDTDVELIAPIDDLLDRGPFMGCEQDAKKNLPIRINPGLGLASVPKMDFYKEILNFYDKQHFIRPDGSLNEHTVVDYTTDLLFKFGLKNESGIQHVNNIIIYPKEYFCPLDYQTGKLTISQNTRSIHHYTATWHSPLEARCAKLERFFCKKYGLQNGEKYYQVVSFPYRIVNRMQQSGLKKTILHALKKFKIKNKD